MMAYGRSQTIAIYSGGSWDMCDSYGLVACQLARCFERMGRRVSAHSSQRVQVGNQPADVQRITARRETPPAGGFHLGPVHNFVHHGDLAHGGPKVAVTMFESSKIPRSWAPILNTFDAVIVPSRWCQDIFRRCGVTAPLHVVPLGLGESFRPVQRTGDDPLTFLAYLDRGARKGGFVALQAFLRAFGDDPKVKLILKWRRQKVSLEFTNTNIEVVEDDLSEAELAALYSRCDVLIAPIKGEGFGLIPREFAATGGIALATNWSATAEEIGLWGWPLPYTLEPAARDDDDIFHGMDLGYWANVDPQAVAAVLVTVRDNIDAFRQIAASQAADVVRHYDWDTCARQMLRVWDSVQERAKVAA